MNRTWMQVTLGVSLSLSLLAAGCGAGGVPSAGGQEQVQAGAEDSAAGQAQDQDTGKTIYLYGNDFVDLVAPKFTNETGFKMEAVHYGGGEALAKIEAEQGNPQWDVVMMDGHGSIRSLADRGFLTTGWKPANLTKLGEFGASLVPADYAYFPVGVHASAVIAYNTKKVEASRAPKTWEQFFAYPGPVGHADPAVAAPAYPLVSAFFHQWGVEAAEAKYRQRFKDGLQVYPKNGPVGKALVSGEIHVAALQEHNAYELKLAGEPIEVIWPDEGAPGSLRVVAISKDAKNPAAAKAFVEFMLKPETQAMLTSLTSSDSFFTPLAQGVEMRQERRQDGRFLLPPAEWASEREAPIKTWFADQHVK